MESEIENCTSLDELFDVWEKEEIHKGKEFVRDGFVCKKEWDSSEYKKILFVLKEAYGDVEDGSITKWLKDCKNLPQMWKRVVEWAYGINNTNESYIGEFPSILFNEEGTSTEAAKKLLKSIAIINLKKSNGQSLSNKKEINLYAKNDSEFLKKQIQLISPDIIVCGFTLDALDKYVYGKEIKKNKCDDWFYNTCKITNRETIVIDYYHPAAWSTKIEDWGDPEVRYHKLAECYQQALLSKIKE